MITKTGIHVDESSDFTNPRVYEENGQVNHVVADNLTSNTRYYTRGYVISDGSIVYSDNVRSFTTKENIYMDITNIGDTSGELTIVMDDVIPWNESNPEYAIIYLKSSDTSRTIPAWNTSNGGVYRTYSIAPDETITVTCKSTKFSRDFWGQYTSDDNHVIYTFKGGNGGEFTLSGKIPTPNRKRFYQFSNLVDASNLAVDHGNNCLSMFESCSRLKKAPVITSRGSKSRMFYGCSSLNEIIVTATGWNTSSCTDFSTGVAATGDFYNLGGANIPINDRAGVPSGWTLHTSL